MGSEPWEGPALRVDRRGTLRQSSKRDGGEVPVAEVSEGQVTKHQKTTLTFGSRGLQ